MRKKTLHIADGFTRLASEINDWTAVRTAEIVPVPKDVTPPEARSIQLRFNELLPRQWRSFTTNLELQTTSSFDKLQQHRLGGQVLRICAESRATMTALVTAKTRDHVAAKRMISQDLQKTADSIKTSKIYREHPEELNMDYFAAIRRSRNLLPDAELTPQEMLRGSLYLGTVAMAAIIDAGKAESLDIAEIPVTFTSF